jgi:predicted PurR-regulated permease PerM
MTKDRFRRVFLLILVIGVSAAFLTLLRPFALTILTAAIFSGLAYPLYSRLLPVMRGHQPVASAVTLLLVLVLVIGPLLAILGIVANQAILVTENIRPVVERFVNEPTYLEQQLERIPGLEPYREQILTRVGDVVDTVGSFLVSSLSGATRGTATFVFHFFMLLYTMFFLLMDGPAMLRKSLQHLPLREEDTRLMTSRFMSVTRATVKGTIVIGIIQGTLAGLAFWAVGIPNTLFWTVVMVVLSILPVIGGALVWVPACIILAATGRVLEGVLLATFCALIVGSVDNLLRPRLVGRDTQMHDILILFSTLGGILAFGPVGFIVGPILAGLFVTSWDIFGVAYRDVLAGGGRPVTGDASSPVGQGSDPHTRPVSRP